MQNINRRRHEQAPIHLRLELASKPVTGSRFAHLVEQFSVFVQEIHALEVFLLDFVIQPKCFFFKAKQEKLLDAFVTFLAVRGIRLPELIDRADPIQRRRMRHRHAMSIRDFFLGQQTIVQKLGTAAVCIIRKRKILDAVEIRFTGKRILAHLHIRITEEHPRSTTAPKERILRRIAEVRSGFDPHATLEVAVANAESRPLAFQIALESLVDEFLVAVNRLIVHQLLFKFKAA